MTMGWAQLTHPDDLGHPGDGPAAVERASRSELEKVLHRSGDVVVAQGLAGAR
jgi:hypothetical protein